MKIIRVRNRHNPWMSPEILSLMYKRDHIHKKAVKTGDMTLWEEFKHMRNKVVHDINNAKKRVLPEPGVIKFGKQI